MQVQHGLHAPFFLFTLSTADSLCEMYDAHTNFFVRVHMNFSIANTQADLAESRSSGERALASHMAIT